MKLPKNTVLLLNDAELFHLESEEKHTIYDSYEKCPACKSKTVIRRFKKAITDKDISALVIEAHNRNNPPATGYVPVVAEGFFKIPVLSCRCASCGFTFYAKTDADED